MKCLNDGNTDDGNNHNWLLGFSLTPHMKMEVTSGSGHHNHDHHHYYHHQHQPHPSDAAASSAVSSTASTTNFYLSPSQLNASGICYGVVGENSAFHSPLAMMPLKSDGSLCIMEALSRSQNQGWSNMVSIFLLIPFIICCMHSNSFLFRVFLTFENFSCGLCFLLKLWCLVLLPNLRTF